MSISIRCPACGVALRVDDSLAGRKVRCSGCNKPFTAEVDPPEDEPEEEAPRPAKRPSLRKPAVDQPLIPTRRPRGDEDEDEERPKPVPVWKREMMGAGVYLGCLGVFSLLSIGAVLIFMFYFNKQVAPLVQPPPKPEIEVHLDNLKDLDPNKRLDTARRLRTAEPNVERRDDVARALAKCLEDSNPESAKAAAEALVVWATPNTAADIAAALPKASPEVRKRCLEALQKIGPGAENAIVGQIRSPDKNLRRELCALLGRVGTRGSLAPLNALATDPDPVVKRTAEAAVRAIQERNP